MNPRPRLVHLTTTDMSLSLLLGPQLQAFAEAGYEVVGVSSDGPFVAELQAAGIRHIPLAHATRAHAITSDVRALVELRALLRRLGPDILHTHNPKPGIYGRLAGAWAGVPGVVNTVHGLYALPEDRWPKRAAVYGLERLAATCSDVELIQNPEDIEVLARLGVPRAKLRLLGNGIDLARFDRASVAPERVAQLRREVGAGPGDVVCGAVGRLVWEKGYATLFEAAAALRQRVPHARFVVIGPSDPDKADGLSDHDLTRAREQAGITFLGMRTDLTELYAAMDVYVLASHREGYPRSAMEAAAMGLAVVATDIRGCRQVVDHGVTGLLVAPRDAAALTDALTTVMADAALRARMSQAALEKARREFDQQQVIDITLQAYGDVLDQTAKGRGRGRRPKKKKAPDQP